MKRKAVFAAGAVAAVLAALYLWGPSSVPAGQVALTELSTGNFGEFRSAFDGAADVPRLVLLLSPT